MTPKNFLKKEEWAVSPVSLCLGQEMVKSFHYAKGGSNTCVYMHGLIRLQDKKVFGVAWWLPPTRVACESVNKDWTKVLSLTRLVCLPEAPKNAASFLIRGSVRMIKKEGRFKSLVTYADESQGHVGGIYKASGWVYVGRTGPYPKWVDQSGKQVACKATYNRTKSEMEALGHKMIGRFYKHKFVIHL